MKDHVKLDEEESQSNIKQEAIEIHAKEIDPSIDNNIYKNEHQQIEMKTTVDEIMNDNDIHSKSIDQIYLDSPTSPIPEQFKKTFFLTMSLFLIGIILILIGIINSVIKRSFKEGITFWVLGFIVFTPGGFYIYQFYRYKKATNRYEREEILSQIPEL